MNKEVKEAKFCWLLRLNTVLSMTNEGLESIGVSGHECDWVDGIGDFKDDVWKLQRKVSSQICNMMDEVSEDE